MNILYMTFQRGAVYYKMGVFNNVKDVWRGSRKKTFCKYIYPSNTEK